MHILDQLVNERHLLNHPFYQRWMAGTLTFKELQRYVVNYYPHVSAFPTYVSAVHSQCSDLKTRQALLENLIEEERGEENHPELWLRFGEALGLTRSDIEETKSLPVARELVETFKKLTRKGFASGLGALYAYESQVPSVAQQKIEGLKKHYGISNAHGLKFFEVHRKADQFHSETERMAFDLLSQEEKQEACEAAQEAGLALWNFLSGLDRVEGKSNSCASMMT